MGELDEKVEQLNIQEGSNPSEEVSPDVNSNANVNSNSNGSDSKDEKLEKVAQDLHMSKDQMVGEILRLKSSINSLTTNIRDTKTVCDKYENDNQYLQDYVGTLMKNNDISK